MGVGVESEEGLGVAGAQHGPLTHTAESQYLLLVPQVPCDMAPRGRPGRVGSGRVRFVQCGRVAKAGAALPAGSKRQRQQQQRQAAHKFGAAVIGVFAQLAKAAHAAGKA